MKEYIYDSFYGKPLDEVILIMILLLFFWSILYILRGNKLALVKWWKYINGSVVSLNFFVIVIVTLLERKGKHELILIPFHSFSEARIQPELYRSMLMNVFLFFPLGLTLPYALPEKWNKKVLLSILFAMVLSIGIEFAQYHFHLGRAETDDVICNTLGCAIGTISYLLANRKNKASV